jgi:hypothetical protein
VGLMISDVTRRCAGVPARICSSAGQGADRVRSAGSGGKDCGETVLAVPSGLGGCSSR